MKAKEKLTLALDVDSLDKAIELISQTKDYVGYYKVGKEILNAVGLPKVLKTLKEQNVKVFVDVKEMDIPNTVKNAVIAAARHGADIINIHASGGYKMMSEAVKAAKSVNPKIKVVAVSILTSLNDKDMADIGYLYNTETMVLKLASLAKKAGCDGLVCSPKELGLVRAVMGNDAFIITPGIRGAHDVNVDDQKRVTLPSDAVFSGCSTMVVGRSITRSEFEPHIAARHIYEDIHKALMLFPEKMKPVPSLNDVLVEHLLAAGVVKTGNFTLKSGAVSPIYINVRDLATNHQAFSLAVFMLAEKIKKLNIQFNRIGGVPMGALSIANALALALESPVLTLRAEAKNHGLVGTKTVESFKADSNVLVIEDVATSGGSIREAVEKYRSLGLQVNNSFVVVDREQGAKEMLSTIGVNLHSLITLSEIIQALVKRKDITPEMKKQLLAYIAKS